MVRTKDELLAAIRSVVTDDASDEAIAVFEDVSDTLDNASNGNWEEKYKENDKKWREKYRERFFNKSKENEDEEDECEEKETKKAYSYDELFKED